MTITKWKRFAYWQRGVQYFLALNFIFNIFNNIYNLIPFDLAAYAFWLSLGIFLGFQLCRVEANRFFRKDESELKDKSGLKKV